MKTRWEALRTGLIRSVECHAGAKQFRRLTTTEPRLARFESAASLLDFFESPKADLREKNKFYEALVRLVQARGESGRLALTLLLLGLWPALDRIHTRRRRLFGEDPPELASRLVDCFTALVEHIDLASNQFLISALTRGTDRDLLEAYFREKADSRRGVSWADTVSHLAPPRVDGSAAFDFDLEVQRLRQWLAARIGDDADLLLAVAVAGESQREIAERLGIHYEAAHKRFVRARDRVRALPEFRLNRLSDFPG